jgi:hypothetical protein
MLRFDDVPAGLIAVLSKLDLYKHVRWQSYEQDDRRDPTDKLTEAVCVSSRIREQEPVNQPVKPTGFLPDDPADSEKHYLMIDLDVPAFLVPSTHPGHSHLYVEQEIPWRDLEHLLRALAACGVIEQGYAAASIDRKSTTLRLPWIAKEPEGDDTLISIGAFRALVDKLAHGPGQYEGQVGMGFLATFDQELDELRNDHPRVEPGDADTLTFAVFPPPIAAPDPEPYRSPWMDVGDKLRAPEKYDVIDETHNCGHVEAQCGMTEWHEWHDWYRSEMDGTRSQPRHCPGKRP